MMKTLLVISIVLLTLAGCVAPVVKQPLVSNTQSKAKKTHHKPIAQHNINNDKNLSSDGVPVVNLMAYPGGANA